MTHQFTHRRNQTILVLLLAFALLFFPLPVHAWEENEIPPLDSFIAQVTNGETDELRGLYAPGVLAHVIVSQPENNLTYISSEPFALTEFEMASRYETIGLLAHNYFAGNDFFRLKEGQILYLIYGDGHIETYIVQEFLRYQALTPKSTTSDFVDLETRELLTSSQLFLKVFDRPGEIVLQTCIYADGNASWGRLFIIATPYRGDGVISISDFPSMD